ncbi:anti-sigma-factor antagonist [Nostoc linckia z18]|jgi:anti-sigma B factor antagonist|uniref:Anti-sigma factor antagonist n=2 Tax=Nostoc linckia TaxID=92942 RepID=A0A9Q5ZBZ2_NOSLI|nr:STAS domain-containing protein [Nostoc linckia]PHK41613.1 anti-sigma-factor antagonist [Nostoc linckia z15]PHK46082.1 anti-sigma-factor antagonist [Nostoc linckia z16]PHJ68282.1 anti-sigma-factor antagonist [Nostoc linckia z1]PHJ73720.1 anti-sigma-factor antagonist [Nostoc linckia z3]PHJ78288.1 anti-sigma-factor antagonist [Nostoc linckia z2]
MQAVLQYPKIAVIQPQGSLNAANALEVERDLTTELTKNDISILMVDLGAVESLDSAGLMALLSVHKLALSLERSFRLCNIAPSVKIIFELTQLDRVFEILESETDLSAT